MLGDDKSLLWCPISREHDKEWRTEWSALQQVIGSTVQICILHKRNRTETASGSHGMFLLLLLLSKFLGILPNRIHQCVTDVSPLPYP
jgi:hypothetical protein